jgi:hypothetical protein
MTIKPAKLHRKFDVDEKSDISVRISGRGDGLAGLGFKGNAAMVLLSLILFSFLVEMIPLFLAFFFLFAPAGLYHVLRSRPFDFTLTKDGVVKGQTAYSDEHIEKFRVYNSSRGSKLNQSLSYQVGMDYDHKLTPLTSQLKEETANQIFDVILKFKSLTKVDFS